jgi:hypothetical protein
MKASKRRNCSTPFPSASLRTGSEGKTGLEPCEGFSSRILYPLTLLEIFRKQPSQGYKRNFTKIVLIFSNGLSTTTIKKRLQIPGAFIGNSFAKIF